jgi:hypothetical protein
MAFFGKKNKDKKDKASDKAVDDEQLDDEDDDDGKGKPKLSRAERQLLKQEAIRKLRRERLIGPVLLVLTIIVSWLLVLLGK